jgi:hypothetical protein
VGQVRQAVIMGHGTESKMKNELKKSAVACRIKDQSDWDHFGRETGV